MSGTLIIGLLFIVICILYGKASKSYNCHQQDFVLETKAGTTKDADAQVCNHESKPSKIIKLPNGNYINTNDLIRIEIKGNCMRPRNVYDGEEWLVFPIDSTKKCEEQIKPKDIVLIYLEDKNIYKIREVRSFLGNQFLDTIYYDNDGETNQSSKPHSYASVRGILRFAI